ncbi:MAG TPA: hypothetical protein DET40_06125 [Lentisphaeria bacterium]|nr:hypothetical protein [Lentisphaeria bacterium]
MLPFSFRRRIRRDLRASFNSVSLKTGALKGKKLRVSWFNPRNGTAAKSAVFENTGTLTVTTPLDGPDWVLILDAE